MLNTIDENSQDFNNHLFTKNPSIRFDMTDELEEEENENENEKNMESFRPVRSFRSFRSDGNYMAENSPFVDKTYSSPIHASYPRMMTTNRRSSLIRVKPQIRPSIYSIYSIRRKTSNSKNSSTIVSEKTQYGKGNGLERTKPPNVTNDEINDMAMGGVIEIENKNNENDAIIMSLLSNNRLDDLKRFLVRRERLNKINMCLIYIFHFFQSTGIFLTALSTRFDNAEIIWLGIFCNFVASIINTYEHINNSISEKTLADIISIKENTYIDESNILDDGKI
jgi:hypothetical protein